jgi:purine nucleoside phosphorylase
VARAIPHVKYALIGGSGTWGIRFPEDLGRDDIELVDVFEDGFETPYGRSIAYKLLRIGGELVLRTAMHGIPASRILSSVLSSTFKQATPTNASTWPLTMVFITIGEPSATSTL